MERHRDEPVLIHAFGAWSYAGALALEHLRRRGRRAVMVASSYATHVDESRAMLEGAFAEGTWRERADFAWQYLQSLAEVDRYERHGYRAAHVVVVNYAAVARAIGRRHGAGVRIERARYSSDGAFASYVGDATGARAVADAPRIVSVSGHFQRKGIDVLLHACALLRDRGVRFRADVVGGGTLLDAHRALAHRLELDGLVEMFGVVPAVRPYLDRADIFALPSRSEQSGSLALIEALEAGLPTVASDCDGIPEDLGGSEAGILVDPADPVALADALERLIHDPSERERRAMAARALFTERFSPAAFASDIGRIYAQALASI
jgi:glycosyltransferase involved in cell wall biosynthesis